MRLRARLAATVVAITLPLMLALFAFDAFARHRAASELLVEITFSELRSGPDRCVASPATWPGDEMNGPPGPQPGDDHGPPPGDDHGPPPDEDCGPPPGGDHRGPPPGEDRGPPGDHRGPPRGGLPPSLRIPRRPVFFAYDDALHSQNPAAPRVNAELAAALQGRDIAWAPFRWNDEVEVLVRTPWSGGPCAVVLGRGSTVRDLGAILPETGLLILPMGVVLAALLLAMGPVVGRIRRLTEAVQRSARGAYAGPIPIRGRDEIGDLARAFVAAAGEIREQIAEKAQRERALRDFLGNTTHDVMIPLTVLQGHLATLRDHAAAGGAADAEVVSAAMNEAHYLASLVHNLAVVARLDAAELSLQTSAVDLEALVSRVVDRHAPIARERGVTLVSAAPPAPLHVSADVTLLEQAVSNVTYNAVRYNRRGGHVAVILERAGAGGFRLRVLDDGPGVPADQLAAILERGARSDEARTRAPEGQGLGLHIARRAAELHGFRLTLGPSEHGGLEVTLEGPAIGDGAIRP